MSFPLSRASEFIIQWVEEHSMRQFKIVKYEHFRGCIKTELLHPLLQKVTCRFFHPLHFQQRVDHYAISH